MKKPVVGYDRRQKTYVVDYALSRETEPLEGVADASIVTWLRVTPNGDTLAVKETADNMRKRTYAPTVADEGCEIIARVSPRYDDTETGKAAQSNLIKVGRGSSQEEVSTDFSDVPIRYAKTLTHRGVWLMDSHKPHDTERYAWVAEGDEAHPTWRYGKGVDGARRTGLVTERRGARLTFTPAVAACSSQTVVVEVDPCKPAGQGFGSATGQYFDIRMMFDPLTMSGYALRIYRTPEHDKAVEMVLLRYDEGKAVRLCLPAVTRDFKAGCRIEVSLKDGLLTAHLSRDGGERTSLSAPAKATGDATVQLQHTGSVGASGLVLAGVSITTR